MKRTPRSRCSGWTSPDSYFIERCRALIDEYLQADEVIYLTRSEGAASDHLGASRRGSDHPHASPEGFDAHESWLSFSEQDDRFLKESLLPAKLIAIRLD